jgi:hypothetical protein
MSHSKASLITRKPYHSQLEVFQSEGDGSPEDEVPQEMQPYIAKNADYFEQPHSGRKSSHIRGSGFGLPLFSQVPEPF